MLNGGWTLGGWLFGRPLDRSLRRRCATSPATRSSRPVPTGKTERAASPARQRGLCGQYVIRPGLGGIVDPGQDAGVVKTP